MSNDKIADSSTVSDEEWERAMSLDPNPKHDYKVGYKKPPKHSQFKKGQSGNKKGRPRESKNVAMILRSIWDKPVLVNDNGKKRKIPYFEAFMTKMAEKALNGSTRDQIALLKAFNDYAPELLHGLQSNFDDITVTFVMPEGHTVEDYHHEVPITPRFVPKQ